MLRRNLRPSVLSTSGAARFQTGHTLQGHLREYEQQARQQKSEAQASQQQRNAAASSPSDWLLRVQREMLVEQDPLGGQFHKDYFRDPAKGYAPTFAPRNYENGGAVDYFHPLSSTHYSTNQLDRDAAGHILDRTREAARDSRKVLREATSAEEITDFLSQRGGGGESRHGSEKSYGTPTTQDAFREVIRSGTADHRIGNMAPTNPRAYPPVHAGLTPETIQSAWSQQNQARNDDLLDEALRKHHGLRDKEAFEFDVKQRMEYLPFKGYDMDRYLAAQGGTLFGMNQTKPLVAPGSTSEAHTNVRRNSVPNRESIVSKLFAGNTLRSEPKLGESLSDEVAATLRGDSAQQQLNETQERQTRFGLGRQGPLVQDGGPDRRVIQRHKNDERLLNAAIFDSYAYEKTATDSHIDPVERNDVTSGVAHLLETKFDIERRQRNFAQNKSDPTERATIFYGKPVQQEIDDYVFRRRNAKSERSLDYYKPFPGFRDLRLQRVYRDLEGFPLMKQRPDFLEWELFTRYRAHMEQRRELALKHNLEPVPNESCEERDARRRKLDELCEATPFDASRLVPATDELKVDAQTLRSWFGMYLLPSPTVVQSVHNGTIGLVLHAQTDELGTADKREHLMSARYFNKLMLDDAYQGRVGRSFLKDFIGKMADPKIAYKQPESVLQHFSPEERAVYDAYIATEMAKHTTKFDQYQLQKKRWVASHKQYGRVVETANPLAVVDVEKLSDGSIITIAEDEFKDAIAQALQDPSKSIVIDKQDCRLLPHSSRSMTAVQVVLDNGVSLEMDEIEFNKCATEVEIDDPNAALNFGIAKYDYNRTNYIETQDRIWEERTQSGEEGWSPATHADGLRVGLPVLCRRLVSGSTRGDFRNAVIVQYLKQPFFNPNPRTISVQYADGAIERVPLSETMIWQRQYYGPERSVGDQTRRFSQNMSKRYVNVVDPSREKERTTEHFLDKYERRSAEASADALKSLKLVSEIDEWNSFDTKRSENHRLLSISHRKDYIRGEYFTRYTPWEWIAVQEADQPLLWSQLRQDNTGPSHYHSPNRFWRWKARPHGYIRNFEHEVRDLFQYVDGVTPWAKAKKIRTYWEVREHHPIPQFNRPEVAIHRNTVGLLPSHMWDTDKKTGRVKSVKDSVRDYQTPNPIPSWAAL